MAKVCTVDESRLLIWAAFICGKAMGKAMGKAHVHNLAAMFNRTTSVGNTN
jgi:hypothetical protein